MTVMPLTGDMPAVEQMMEAGSPPRSPLASAMTAKVGAAARLR
jgi:hypothetical protein